MRQGQLLGEIPIVGEVVPLGEVPSHNTNQVEFVNDPAGQRWVLKRGMCSYNSVLAEAIGYGMSTLLRIPTPRAGVYRDESGTPLWMSMYLPSCLHWAPELVYNIKNLGDVGRMLALDTIIGNDDRNVGNILLQPHRKEFRAFSIDLEQSWVGAPPDLIRDGAVRDDLPRLNRAVAKTLPIDALADPMQRAAQDAAQLAEPSIRSAVGVAYRLFNESAPQGLCEALLCRCLMAPQLVARRIQEIENFQ